MERRVMEEGNGESTVSVCFRPNCSLGKEPPPTGEESNRGEFSWWKRSAKKREKDGRTIGRRLPEVV